MRSFWRRKISAPIAVLAALASAGAPLRSSADEDVSADFKFPLLLCVYQYSVVERVDGALTVRAVQSTDFAYRVRDIQWTTLPAENGALTPTKAMSGIASGEFSIPSSSYRVRFEAQILQGVSEGNTHELTLRSILEKRDGGDYYAVGEKTTTGRAATAVDGTVARNVFARAANNETDSYRGVKSRIEPKLVQRALASAQLRPGTVFNGGAACGLFDSKTALQLTSHKAEFADISHRPKVRRVSFFKAGMRLRPPVDDEPSATEVAANESPKTDTPSPADAAQNVQMASASEQQQQDPQQQQAAGPESTPDQMQHFAQQEAAPQDPLQMQASLTSPEQVQQQLQMIEQQKAALLQLQEQQQQMIQLQQQQAADQFPQGAESAQAAPNGAVTF